MPEPHTFRLSGRGHDSTDYELSVDGHDITNAVTSIELRIGARQRPVLVLHPLVFEADKVEGQADVVVMESAREMLTRLGWTPPIGDHTP